MAAGAGEAPAGAADRRLEGSVEMPYFEIPCHFPARALVREFRCDKIPCRQAAPPIAMLLLRNVLLPMTGIGLRLGFDFFPEFSRAAGN
jgi:hypothetical protein